MNKPAPNSTERRRVDAQAKEFEGRESACGDVIVFKRLKPAKLSAIAARRPEKEMPLAKIDAEVQAHRKAKRPRKP